MVGATGGGPFQVLGLSHWLVWIVESLGLCSEVVQPIKRRLLALLLILALQQVQEVLLAIALDPLLRVGWAAQLASARSAVSA